jgi:DNA (cytosine-5)-methyltransferase 1
MRYASICDGIGAVHVAWQPLGWQCAWTSEISPFPAAVVEHHWKLPNLGDMTKITKEQIQSYGQLDLICGGTPCQSFSVAGLRKGLADPRGNLALEFLRLVDAARPRWVVWENVPGVLSSLSHDAPDPCPPPPPLDMECDGQEVDTEDEYSAEELHALNCFLAGLSELGYGWAVRVLDAQHVRVDGHEHAVPQRRRRVFVVGYLGSWQRAAAVLFERNCLSGNPAPRRQAGQGTAPGTCPSLTASGRSVERTGESRGQDPVVCGTLHTEIRRCSGQDNPAEYLVSHALRGEGFDASEDGTGRGIPMVCGALSDGAHMGGAATDRTPTPDESFPSVAWALQERDSNGPDSSTKEGHLIPVGGFFSSPATFPWQMGGGNEAHPVTPSQRNTGQESDHGAFDWGRL